MANCVTRIAERNGRDYITPEDVTAAFEEEPRDVVRLAVLDVIGGKTGFDAEDLTLCAFVASEGNIEAEKGE